eukprot:354140-Chlamydomonas_euryale.AAC.13
MGRGTRACGRMGFCKAQARRVRLPAWLAAWLAAWLVARLAACLAGWLAGWLAAWPAAWLAAWLAARLAAWPGGTGWLPGWLPGPAGLAGCLARREWLAGLAVESLNRLLPSSPACCILCCFLVCQLSSKKTDPPHHTSSSNPWPARSPACLLALLHDCLLACLLANVCRIVPLVPSSPPSPSPALCTREHHRSECMLKPSCR